jgi:hypothetical protein
LWWPIPGWLYILVIVAAICQLIGWAMLLKFIRLHLATISKNLSRLSRVLFLLCGTALTIKLLLQAGSVVPSLSKLAFGFRPIVIGYLHLILLGVISLFIISYSLTQQLILINKPAVSGIIVFTIAIFVNELLLMIQGVSDIRYETVPFINEFLFGAAILLFDGMLIINYSQIFFKDD